jgi:hypothetical protein
MVIIKYRYDKSLTQVAQIINSHSMSKILLKEKKHLICYIENRVGIVTNWSFYSFGGSEKS